MPPAASMAFSTTHWVSNWVHCTASYVGPATHVAFSACFADAYILVVGIAEPADCRSTLFANHPHFTTRQNNSDPIALFGYDFRSVASTSNQLSTLPAVISIL